MLVLNMTDIHITHQGSVIGFEPVSADAQQWFNAHVRSECWQWLGPILFVDHRMAEVIALALATEGFEINEGLS